LQFRHLPRESTAGATDYGIQKARQARSKPTRRADEPNALQQLGGRIDQPNVIVMGIGENIEPPFQQLLPKQFAGLPVAAGDDLAGAASGNQGQPGELPGEGTDTGTDGGGTAGTITDRLERAKM